MTCILKLAGWAISHHWQLLNGHEGEFYARIILHERRFGGMLLTRELIKASSSHVVCVSVNESHLSRVGPWGGWAWRTVTGEAEFMSSVRIRPCASRPSVDSSTTEAASPLSPLSPLSFHPFRHDQPEKIETWYAANFVRLLQTPNLMRRQIKWRRSP